MPKKRDDKDNQNLELVRLVTAGSVDDGKSTLIGRLLYESGSVYSDQLAELEKKKNGPQIDYSLLLDGLSAEREQGITIDVAYRYFCIGKRKFIIADVPGHEEYTRNMATGASRADMALILIDATKGMLVQSKRHLFIASLFNISHIAVLINKMDLVNYQKEVFEKIKDDFIRFAAKLNINDLRFIPVSAIKGDMVVKRGKNMGWYHGSTLIDYLENAPIVSQRNLMDFRLPIQMVIRHQQTRYYAGLIESGVIKQNDQITVLPSFKKAKIKSILVAGKKSKQCFASQSALIALDKQLDISRGNMLVRPGNLPLVGHNFEAAVCWFSDQPLKEGQSYLIKHTTQTTRAFINKLRYEINPNSLHRKYVGQLKFNAIGRVYFKTNHPLFFDVYTKNKNTGSFIIIDEITNNTVGAGVIVRQLNGSLVIKTRKRDSLNAPTGAVLWFTGLSGSGKSTLAREVYKYLKKKNIKCEMLDGDILRKNITAHLGFSKEDRLKNIQIAGFITQKLAEHGVVVLASFISPYAKQRRELKKKIKNFVEIYINAPLEICQQRDVKGLYKKVKQGKIKSFTGIDDIYEPPENPAIEIKTDQLSIKQSTAKIIDFLNKNVLSKN